MVISVEFFILNLLHITELRFTLSNVTCKLSYILVIRWTERRRKCLAFEITLNARRISILIGETIKLSMDVE